MAVLFFARLARTFLALISLPAAFDAGGCIECVCVCAVVRYFFRPPLLSRSPAGRRRCAKYVRCSAVFVRAQLYPCVLPFVALGGGSRRIILKTTHGTAGRHAAAVSFAILHVQLAVKRASVPTTRTPEGGKLMPPLLLRAHETASKNKQQQLRGQTSD